jgi:hypothetical protein
MRPAFSGFLALAAVGTLLLGSVPALAAALEIAKVRADRVRFDPAKGERLGVAFRLTAPAKVELQIYDGRELRIRRVESRGELPAGDHKLIWDGRDEAGRPVPPEAYHYTLAARSADGREVVHDLTDTTGGETLNVGALGYDAKAKRVTYVLPALARVNLRVGLAEGGPLLRTLADWVPREAGQRSEPWDGKDASGVLDVGAHPGLALVGNAFSLPQNTVLVGGGEPSEVTLIEPLTFEAPLRPNRAQRPRRHGDYPAQPIETRRDVTIALELGGEVPRSEDGLPIVSAAIAVRMTVPDAKEAERILAERFETTFFLDGAYRFENESGFLPATWLFDPAGVAPGVHYLTGNLLGYEGHFGMATLAIEVRASAGAQGEAR